MVGGDACVAAAAVSGLVLEIVIKVVLKIVLDVVFAEGRVGLRARCLQRGRERANEQMGWSGRGMSSCAAAGLVLLS